MISLTQNLITISQLSLLSDTHQSSISNFSSPKIINQSEKVDSIFVFTQEIPFNQGMKKIKFNSRDHDLLLRLQNGRLKIFHCEEHTLLQTIDDLLNGDWDVRAAAVLKRIYCFAKPTQHLVKNILKGMVCPNCCRLMKFVEEKDWEISRLEGAGETVEMAIK